MEIGEGGAEGGGSSRPMWYPLGQSWEMADENFNKASKQIGKDIQMDKNR